MNIFHNLYFFSNLRAVCEIFLHSLVFKTSSQWFTSRLLLCGDALFFLPVMCDEPIFSADGHELAQFFFSISKIVYSTFTFSFQIVITHIIKIRSWLVWLKKWAILLDRKIKNPWKYSIKWKTNFIKDKHLQWGWNEIFLGEDLSSQNFWNYKFLAKYVSTIQKFREVTSLW